MAQLRRQGKRQLQRHLSRSQAGRQRGLNAAAAERAAGPKPAQLVEKAAGQPAGPVFRVEGHDVDAGRTLTKDVWPFNLLGCILDWTVVQRGKETTTLTDSVLFQLEWRGSTWLTAEQGRDLQRARRVR